MDIDLALTFLEIARSRSFFRAAGQLHVTPTTVSARVKAGAAMTPAGEQFLSHASCWCRCGSARCIRSRCLRVDAPSFRSAAK